MLKHLYQLILISLVSIPVFAQRPAASSAYFDGERLVGLENPGKWKIENGAIAMLSAGKTGRLITSDSYNDIQFHLDWKTPYPPLPSNSGNSGVMFGPYELQILDSYKQKSKSPDAQAGSIYGQYPPYVNACLPPEQWTSCEILFHNARFNSSGKVIKPARMTVVHNGIFIHHDRVLVGEILRKKEDEKTILYNEYIPHEEIRVSLQEHGSIVSFRNIWLLEENRCLANNELADLDLARMEQAQKDPSHWPYSKSNPEPPVVNPATNNLSLPSDAHIIEQDQLQGEVGYNEGQISANGLISIAGEYDNSQLHFMWTGNGKMILRVLDAEFILGESSPGIENIVDIAISVETISKKTMLCITFLTNGIFHQKRKVVKNNKIEAIEFGIESSEYTISDLWVRELDPFRKP